MWKLSPKCFQTHSATLHVRTGTFHLKNQSRFVSRSNASMLDHVLSRHKPATEINLPAKAECKYIVSQQQSCFMKRYSQQYTLISSLNGCNHHSKRWLSSKT